MDYASVLRRSLIALLLAVTLVIVLVALLRWEGLGEGPILHREIAAGNRFAARNVWFGPNGAVIRNGGPFWPRVNRLPPGPALLVTDSLISLRQPRFSVLVFRGGNAARRARPLRHRRFGTTSLWEWGRVTVITRAPRPAPPFFRQPRARRIDHGLLQNRKVSSAFWW